MLTARSRALSPAYLLLILIPVSYIGWTVLNNPDWVPNSVWQDIEPVNPLDGCLHVYLDMGSNRGVQIRKLYEPEKFPDADILPVFEKYFGSPTSRDLSKICAVGFEPNAAFAPLLTKLESHYKSCGWKVLMHTNTGVIAGGSPVRFKATHNHIAGHLVKESNPGEGATDDVRSVRIASFIKEVVAKRRIPITSEIGNVIMKLDIEGGELGVFPDLMFSGALTHVDMIGVEFHSNPNTGNVLDVDPEKVRKLAESVWMIRDLINEQGLGNTVASMSHMDDETYTEYDGELPVCN